jgi:hypothetical protein
LSTGGANHLLLVQNDFTECRRRFFLKEKRKLPDTIFDWLKLVKEEASFNVNRIQFENSGENKTFHQFLLKPDFKNKYDVQHQILKCPCDPLWSNTSYNKSARITNQLQKGLCECCDSIAVQLENVIEKEKH